MEGSGGDFSGGLQDQGLGESTGGGGYDLHPVTVYNPKPQVLNPEP
jgi:hypothetical protein